MPQRLPLHFFSIYTPVSDYSFKSRSVCRGLLNLHLQFGSQIHTYTFISDTFTHMSNGHLTFDMSKMKFPHFKLVPSQPDHASPYSLRPLQSKPQLMCFWIIVFFLPFPHEWSFWNKSLLHLKLYADVPFNETSQLLSLPRPLGLTGPCDLLLSILRFILLPPHLPPGSSMSTKHHPALGSLYLFLYLPGISLQVSTWFTPSCPFSDPCCSVSFHISFLGNPV